MVMNVKAARYEKKIGSATLSMVDYNITTNDFSGKDHPRLDAIVQSFFNGQRPDGEDLTWELIAGIPDSHMEVGETWLKARYIAENVACLWLAEHVVSWGFGYRSDDGFDYLRAALDNVAFLTDIDLTEEAFRKWWDAPAWEGEMWGATDGEIRFMLFPNRSEEGMD